MATLVTGASGMVGSEVVRQLEAAGVEVVAVEHRWTHISDVEHAIGGRRVERTIACGWYMNPADCLTNRRENSASFVAGVELATMLCTIEPSPHLVFAGSWWESAYPASAYGFFKRALHHLLAGFGDIGLRLAWLHIYNVTGTGENEQRLFPSLRRALREGRSFALSPGAQTRDFVHVTDVAAGLFAASRCAITGTCDVATGVETAVRAACETIADDERAPRRLLHFSGREYSPGEPMRAVGDPSGLTASTGWRPRLVGLDAVLGRNRHD